MVWGKKREWYGGKKREWYGGKKREWYEGKNGSDSEYRVRLTLS